MAKVLLIDDDPLLARMYQAKFVIDGYQTETASDGEEGVAKAQSGKPNLILLDIMMPKMNGLDVLKKLKEEESTKKIPVILLTNLSTDTHVQEGLDLGAVAYLVKADYTPKEVVQKVKEILAGYTSEVPPVKTIIKDQASKK